jgi:hypothetical protein
MEDSAIWRLALYDIVEVVPLRIVRDIIPTMSLRDIRRTVIRAVRMDFLLDNQSIQPARVRSVTLGADVVGLEIGHGGQWILIMHEDGSIHLHHIRNMDKSVLLASRPEYDKLRTWDPAQMCILLSSWRGTLLAVAYEHYSTPGSVLVVYSWLDTDCYQ